MNKFLYYYYRDKIFYEIKPSKIQGKIVVWKTVVDFIFKLIK